MARHIQVAEAVVAVQAVQNVIGQLRQRGHCRPDGVCGCYVARLPKYRVKSRRRR